MNSACNFCGSNKINSKYPKCFTITMKIHKREKPTPEKAMEILSRKGIIVSREQAAKILEFMDNFAKIMIKQYVK